MVVVARVCICYHGDLVCFYSQIKIRIGTIRYLLFFLGGDKNIIIIIEEYV